LHLPSFDEIQIVLNNLKSRNFQALVQVHQKWSIEGTGCASVSSMVHMHEHMDIHVHTPHPDAFICIGQVSQISILLEKLTVAVLVKNFPSFYRMQRSIPFLQEPAT